ncbi:MAG TPA: hypothetical protein DD666_06510 [Advenella kashmirensis]|uniref:Uncharacterized protein n=1 Tax=Advenella kashmirensis TaxID=310575 RepID=A0A356LDY9_9BURK|nr:hypothetical protein [Advenella kashmirensis]
MHIFLQIAVLFNAFGSIGHRRAKFAMSVSQSIKVVSYYGKLIVVPQWTKYIAMNKNGQIFAWEIKPGTNSYLWYIYEQYRFQLVAHGDPNFIQWDKSLRRYYATGHKSRRD